MKREYIHEVFAKTPTFHTKRLILRPMRMFDAFDMYEYARLPETTEYLLWSPHPDIEFTKNYLAFVIGKYKAGECYDWAIVLDGEEEKMIGTCGFARIDFSNNVGEIGYVVNPEFQNRGYATEAVRAVMRFGFETLGLHRIEGQYIIGNEKSLAVMKKCGMQYEGTARGSMLIKGLYRDIGTAAILRDEFERQVKD